MDIYELLKKEAIKYEKLEHPAVFTVEQAKFIEAKIAGIGCKNLFLKSDDQRYFLYVLKGDKKADLKALRHKLGCKKIYFANSEELMKYLNLTPGSVTPLGIVNDHGNVTVLFDHELVNKKLLMHPNVNTATLAIDYQDLLKIIEICQNKYLIV